MKCTVCCFLDCEGINKGIFGGNLQRVLNQPHGAGAGDQFDTLTTNVCIKINLPDGFKMNEEHIMNPTFLPPLFTKSILQSGDFLCILFVQV